MNKLSLFIAIRLLIIFDRIATSFTRQRKPSTPTLLLVRLDRIGDFVLWSESASHYHKLYPNHKITLLTQDSVAPLAEKLPYWQEVWSINPKKFRRNPIYRYLFLKKVSKAGFTITIQPTFSRHFTLGDSIVRATKSRIRIGSTGNSDLMPLWLKKISDKWYTELIPARQKPLMELKRNTEFLNGLSKETFQTSLPFLPTVTHLSKELSITKPYFIIFPGSSWEGRQWPAKYCGQILGQIHHVTGWLGVICGGIGDEILSYKILSLSSYHPLNLTGKTTLPELVEIIKNANILISNETSAIHIAVATSTKSVCILGGGHYGRFMPYDVEETTLQEFLPTPVVRKMKCFGCNWQCKYHRRNGEPVPCIQHITVQEVFNAVLKVLEIDKIT